MTNAPPRFDIAQTADVAAHFTLQFPLDLEFLDGLAQRVLFLRSEILSARAGIDTENNERFRCARAPDTIYRGKGDLESLIVGDCYTCDTKHR